ncbi:MAG: DUF2905 domain-containing protein [candidate division Zixibacteria bacterium]|nr:DUF2905 domain-containing protein [candidate division Zixibacteria bacterium]
MDQSSFQTPGKILFLVGGMLVILGLVFHFGWKIPFLGKLPGDISIKREGLSIYLPIATCVLASIVLTIIANLFFRK